MAEEHGYQRSGKKCREKFENLYKYYKKTKEGKAGRQDGKHYRFFRQLEALYGESSMNAGEAQIGGNSGGGGRMHSQQQNQEGPWQVQNKASCDSLSLSNCSEFETTSSEESSEKNRKKKRGGWKAKIKEVIEGEMRRLMERQEAWLERVVGTLEQKEKERSLREEEWRREESARVEREHRFWAKERAWIEARDAALMDALHKFTGNNYKDIKSLMAASAAAGSASPPPDHQPDPNDNNDVGSEMLSKTTTSKEEEWQEGEVGRLIQLRTGMEEASRRFPDEALWEDIASRMARMGYERSASMCKDKWESITTHSYSAPKTELTSKKRKENYSTPACPYFPTPTPNNNNNNNESSSSLYPHGSAGGGGYGEINEQGHCGHNDASSPSNPPALTPHHDTCFPFLIPEGENLWDNFGLKLSKPGGQN